MKNIRAQTVQQIKFLLLFSFFGFSLFWQPFAHSEPSNVLIVENFDQLVVGNIWGSLTQTKIIDDCGIGGGDNQCLRVAYVPTSEGSERSIWHLPIPASAHYMLTYQVFFEPGFEFVQGGKLPGLGPVTPTTGCEPKASDGWSARLMWRAEGEAMNYFYGQDRQNPCGDGDVSGRSVFEQGRWHSVEIIVSLNSTWQEYDGFMVAKVDDVVVADDRGIRFRGTTGNDTLISHFMFSTFFGGSDARWSPSKTVYARFDNFEVRILDEQDDLITQSQFEAVIRPPVDRPAAPQIASLSSEGIASVPLIEYNFDNDASHRTNSSWKDSKPNTVWVKGFSEERAKVEAIPGYGNELRITYPYIASSFPASGLRWQIALDEPTDVLLMSYDVRFDENFRFDGRGILPGIGHANSDSSKAWKSYLEWDSEGYLIHVGRSAQGFVYDDLVFEGVKQKLSPGQSYEIMMSVKVNSPGLSDGAVEVWVNGQRAGFLNRQQFVESPINVVLSDVFFDTYGLNALSDDLSNTAEQYIWFDNVMIAGPAF